MKILCRNFEGTQMSRNVFKMLVLFAVHFEIDGKKVIVMP